MNSSHLYLCLPFIVKNTFCSKHKQAKVHSLLKLFNLILNNFQNNYSRNKKIENSPIKGLLRISKDLYIIPSMLSFI